MSFEVSKEHMEEFDIGTEGKYNKRGGLNKERGVSQKAKINKRPPPFIRHLRVQTEPSLTNR